jgi:hypothetical protein
MVKFDRLDYPAIIVMPNIFSKTLYQFFNATNRRKTINFWLKPLPEELYWIIFWRISRQIKQMDMLVPLEISVNFFGFMNCRIIQDYNDLFIWRPLS